MRGELAIHERGRGRTRTMPGEGPGGPVSGWARGEDVCPDGPLLQVSHCWRRAAACVLWGGRRDGTAGGRAGASLLALFKGATDADAFVLWFYLHIPAALRLRAVLKSGS